MLIVPESITVDLTTFAASISANVQPSIIPIQPAPGATLLSCWENVSAVCESNGGHSVKGWRLWWIPHILIEAQAHVVWKPPTGSLIDVSPNDDNEYLCCFVPDPLMKERPGLDFVPSRFANLCGESFVNDYILYSGLVAQQNDAANTCGLWLPPSREMMLQIEALRKITELHRKKSGMRKGGGPII